MDGDGIVNVNDTDTDGDGTPNATDSDDDNDGTPDGSDATPTGPGSSTDADGDGIPNGSDTDVDGDGIPNGQDPDVDGDGIPNGQDLNVDGDGLPNATDPDIDGDGIPNQSDTDMDGDGIVNVNDHDTDGDGTPNATDTDDDNDGTPDGSDATPQGPGSNNDVDGDGIPNGQDQDVDGDGINNVFDTDVDGDGIPNNQDGDDDADGTPDGSDSTPQGVGTLTDIDDDGTPNGTDLDVDGDGIPNATDPDIDGDGIPNGQDPDMDGDGIPNSNDPDADGDGIPDNQDGLMFYPLPQPVRLLETRAGFTGCTTPGVPLNTGATLTLPARTTCAGIPAGARAVTGNITVVPSAPGFLTLFPSGATQPTVANSNFAVNEITNNVFTVGLGAGDGAFKIFTSGTTHVVVDVTGYYAPPAKGGLYFHTLAAPVRLLETRPGFTGCFAPGTRLTGFGDPNADPNLDLEVQGRSPLPSPCNSIPASAKVLVGNATSVSPSGVGYLTIYPNGGTRPLVASSNYAGNDVINGPFAVRLGADGKFKIHTFASTDVVVDILGYYSEDVVDANGVGLLFNPLPAPVRLLETRPGGPPLVGCTRTNAPIQGNLNAATHTQQARNFCGLPATAQAVVGNVSVVNTAGAGFLTLFPGNLTTAPLVATSNYPAPATFGYNRHFFVGLSPADGTFKVLTQSTTDLILDASGYFAP